ncbi:MAG: hypothetical protein M3M88_07145 [Thermoproteota archaeon]|nr:hypothetical protein [Thermoproteota archaeon]
MKLHDTLKKGGAGRGRIKKCLRVPKTPGGCFGLYKNQKQNSCYTNAAAPAATAAAVYSR